MSAEPRPLKVVIPGGSGQVGALLERSLSALGHRVVVLSRSGRAPTVAWDGKNLGPWAQEIDGADVVINLAGRTVNCRYTEGNLKQMMDSRVDSTRVVGQAIAQASQPPSVWLQMSTATIYAHRHDAANDEDSGQIGGEEPGVPAYWAYSVEIAKRWEQELARATTPQTRKVALRTAMVMTPDRGGVFDTFLGLTRRGLGGTMAGGEQYVSWIHGKDFVRAITWLIEHTEVAGAVNLAAPNPLKQREFAQVLRREAGVRVGLPATKWMLELGAWALRTDTELVLKSRNVVPGRLCEAGFEFAFATWAEAARDLCARATR